MVVEWLGKDFALDIFAVFPLYGHFDCLSCRIIHRQVSGGLGDLKSPHPFCLLLSFILMLYIIHHISIFIFKVTICDLKRVVTYYCIQR